MFSRIARMWAHRTLTFTATQDWAVPSQVTFRPLDIFSLILKGCSWDIGWVVERKVFVCVYRSISACMCLTASLNMTEVPHRPGIVLQETRACSSAWLWYICSLCVCVQPASVSNVRELARVAVGVSSVWVTVMRDLGWDLQLCCGRRPISQTSEWPLSLTPSHTHTLVWK